MKHSHPLPRHRRQPWRRPKTSSAAEELGGTGRSHHRSTGTIVDPGHAGSDRAGSSAVRGSRPRPLRCGIGLLATVLLSGLLIAPAAESMPVERRFSTSMLGSGGISTPRYAARVDRRYTTSAPVHFIDRARPVASAVPVSPSPFGIAVNHRSGSIYVADAGGATVFDGVTCNARNHAGCARGPVQVHAGDSSIGIAVDETTNTVYITHASDDTVSVVDGRTCNAHLTTGCGEPHPSVHVGSLPSHLVLDSSTGTLYVTNEGAEAPGDTVSMIDTTLCNGRITSGCAAHAPTVDVGAGPSGVVVDRTDHTLYVANGADRTVSVIDTTSCNARVQSGCAVNHPIVHLAGSPIGATVDRRTATLLVPTWDPSAGPDSAGTVSMIDTASCNSAVATQCGRRPVRVRVGSGPIDIAVNVRSRRAYVVNQEDSDITVLDLTRCNAHRLPGCRRDSPTMTIGFDGGGVAVSAETDTIYGVSQDEATVTVLDGRSCNRFSSSGCRHPAPTTRVGIQPAGGALDASTHTLYVANQAAASVSVVDPTVCTASRGEGCRRTWPTIAVGATPKAVAIDAPLHTLYTANQDSSSISAVDTRTCNSHDERGCSRTPNSMAVTGGAFDLAVDSSTQSIYVANPGSGTVSVLDARSCNAHATRGCNRAPATITTGSAPVAVLLDRHRHTLYVSNIGQQTISLIDTRTCNAARTAGCAAVHPTVSIATPRFLALEPAASTLYVSTSGGSTLTMVNTRRCNLRHPNGCAATAPVVHVGSLPFGVVADHATGRILVGNVGDSTVSSFGSASCNARITTGCSQPKPTVDTGGWPTNLILDPPSGTLYVSDNVDATVSIVSLDKLGGHHH